MRNIESRASRTLLIFRAAFLGVCLSVLSSCSLLKKNRAETAASSPLLNVLGGEPDLTEETVENLKAIANSPASMLPTAETAVVEESPDSEIASITEAPISPRVAWKAEGLDPATISPGDIFYQSAGPYLRKAASLIDSLEESRRPLRLEAISTEKKRRTPITLSHGEIGVLRAAAPPDR